jgi:hypothetical protein
MRIESLLQWLKETPAEEAEKRCAAYGTSVGYLRQIAYGNKRAGLIAADIELITDGRCTRQHLRPDDYVRYWPELAEREPANATAGEVA